MDLFTTPICRQLRDVAMALPFDQQRRQQEALALHGVLGEAYLPELLAAFEVPNVDEILQRIRPAN